MARINKMMISAIWVVVVRRDASGEGRRVLSG